MQVGFDVRAPQMPDSVSRLCSLRDDGLLASTPAQVCLQSLPIHHLISRCVDDL